MLDEMYHKAVSGNYDIVICNYWYDSGSAELVEQIHKQDFNVSTKEDIIKNVLSVKIKSALWNKLVKRELYLLAEYPEYNCSEDYVITIQNILKAEKTGYIEKPLYHYRYNQFSLCNDPGNKINRRIEENKNWKILVAILKEKYGDRIEIFEPELSNHINNFKFIYLCDKNLRKMKELFCLYPESHFYIFSLKKIISKVKSIVLTHITRHRTA
jgi:hypothetical protein